MSNNVTSTNTSNPVVSVDLELLNILSYKEEYTKYIRYIKDYSLISNTKVILDDIQEYFKFYPEKDRVEWDDFSSWFGLVRHPQWKKEKLEMYNAVFTQLKIASTTKPNERIIQHFIKLDYATRIHSITSEIFQGKDHDLSLVTGIIDEYSKTIGLSQSEEEAMFASTDIKALLDEFVRSDGLEWRLEDLNVSVGPLHQRDFVIVGARPETGKTSFLCSEFTHMVAQLPPGQEAVIFNNEERGKLMLRLIEAGTGMGLVDIARDENAAVAAYMAAIGGDIKRVRIVEPEGGLSTVDIERILKRGNYGLIGLNVMDKIRGFEKLDEVARLRELAKWCRGLASKYAPVVAVQQADASGEGMRYMTMAQLYGSKTGIQGEADVILMIGCEDSGQDTRYISIPKNKLPGGPRSIPGLRHGKFEVHFDHQTGRFTSSMYKRSP